jgi:fermentation-respiration switch protein FrsA (DUF1100 family)
MRRNAARALAGAGIGAAVVAGGLLLMRAIQDHLIFFPQGPLDATPSVLGLPFEDVALTTADGETLAAWFVSPKQPPMGTVLFLHGNAGNRGHRLHAIEGFVGEGFSILMVDYRGYGGSSGSPTGPGLTLDADAAWAYLTRERRVAAGSIVLYGESIGSVPALRLARRLETEGSSGPAALVVEGGFTTGLEIGKKAFPFLPVSWLLSDPMDNLAAIREVTVPTFFLHGTDDEVIPFEMGRRLYDASGARVKTFRGVEGARHNSVWMVEARALFAEVGVFLRRALEGTTGS